MIRLAVDENFRRQILSGLPAREPGLDIVRVQDVGLRRTPDATILAWAAEQGRILLTHDVGTMPAAAYEMVERGQPMHGLFTVRWDMAVGPAIEEILILVNCSDDWEWDGQVFLPL